MSEEGDDFVKNAACAVEMSVVIVTPNEGFVNSMLQSCERFLSQNDFSPAVTSEEQEVHC